MRLKGNKGYSLIELIVVLAVMAIVGTMALSLIATGSKLYKNIYDRQLAQKDARIAMSYITMRVRQNDTQSGISVSNNVLNILDQNGTTIHSLAYGDTSKSLEEDFKPISEIQ